MKRKYTMRLRIVLLSIWQKGEHILMITVDRPQL